MIPKPPKGVDECMRDDRDRLQSKTKFEPTHDPLNLRGLRRHRGDAQMGGHEQMGSHGPSAHVEILGSQKDGLSEPEAREIRRE